MTTPSNNKKTKNFKDIQNVFTQHMRDPDNNPAPVGVEDRRMSVYRGLVYNNIQNFIGKSFPVIRKIMGDREWHQMLYDYVNRHKSYTPLFSKMPNEFLQYLEHECEGPPENFPYLLELAHYEWLETALSIDTREIDLSNIDQKGNLLEGIPVLNPISIALAYVWPVHEISPRNLPKSPPSEKTYIFVYRRQNDEVGFIVLNLVSAKLVEYLQSNEKNNGHQILTKIAHELKHPNPEIVIQGGLEMMQNFLIKDILLGTKK
mgnify:CR=1 FL=1|jgi:hypothetical protein|tara:strand:+ start:981 stop:1763 length:783 start_codon:yes stop_codon:yes gene_type:complete